MRRRAGVLPRLSGVHWFVRLSTRRREPLDDHLPDRTLLNTLVELRRCAAARSAPDKFPWSVFPRPPPQISDGLPVQNHCIGMCVCDFTYWPYPHGLEYHP
jgi:hypothetical protein